MITKRERALSVLKTIEYQFQKSPESALMCSIVGQAIKDAFSISSYLQPGDAYFGVKYLRGEMIHAELCGVDSEWIRGQIRKAGLDLNDVGKSEEAA